MKKTALTFGLFSLVVVATSFANPTTQSSDFSPVDGSVGGGRKQDKANAVSNFSPVDGSVGGGRKQDKANLVMNNSDLSFASVNQSLAGTKKVD